MSVSLFSHPCHCELLSKVFCISRQTSNWPGLIISFTIDLKMKSEMVCYTKYIQKLMLFFKPRAIKLYDTDFGFSIWKDIFKTQLFMKDRLSLERTFEIKVQFSFLFTQSFDTATKKSKNFTLLNFGMTYWCVFSTCSAYFEVPTEFQTCQNMRALGKMIFCFKLLVLFSYLM